MTISGNDQRSLPAFRRLLNVVAGTRPSGGPLMHNLRKPRMTPEAARRDHAQMLRYMAFHAGAGAVIGLIVGLALILMNIAGLKTLVKHASSPVVPLVLVLVPFTSLFAAAVAATSILTLPYERKFREESEDGKSRD